MLEGCAEKCFTARNIWIASLEAPDLTRLCQSTGGGKVPLDLTVHESMDLRSGLRFPHQGWVHQLSKEKVCACMCWAADVWAQKP